MLLTDAIIKQSWTFLHSNSAMSLLVIGYMAALPGVIVTSSNYKYFRIIICCCISFCYCLGWYRGCCLKNKAVKVRLKSLLFTCTVNYHSLQIQAYSHILSLDTSYTNWSAQIVNDVILSVIAKVFAGWYFAELQESVAVVKIFLNANIIKVVILCGIIAFKASL
jgi:hypothetical protein